ncbi:adenylate/guanylate cyclase domain-containing protein [Myxococcota bacterium]|nr:adenylate/guanylate cyclase domain-containing protein [Myxococcota bacterium]
MSATAMTNPLARPVERNFPCSFAKDSGCLIVVVGMDEIKEHSSDMETALAEREIRVEYQINSIRTIATLSAAVLDFSWAAYIGVGTARFVLEGLAFVAVFGGYAYSVWRITRTGQPRPWLKYVTVSADYMLALVLFVELYRLGFFFARGPEGGAAEFMALLVLLNSLSAFRSGGWIILYSTVLGTGAAWLLAQLFTDSTALAIYAPAMVAASGLLTRLLSKNLTDLFQNLRRRELLMRFLPREVVRGLDAGEISLSLGGVKREATVLLADLRNFTGWAEQQDPNEVVQSLNDYFTAMAGVIWANGGTIDKFMGDAVLAVFGAPVAQIDHATRALAAAQQMHVALAGLNTDRRRRLLPELRMGIALHSGVVLAGNVGSPERMEYTVIGDVVNVTARIEALNKSRGTRILLSETTRASAADTAGLVPLGEVSIRGREEPIRLFGVEEDSGAEPGASR